MGLKLPRQAKSDKEEQKRYPKDNWRSPSRKLWQRGTWVDNEYELVNRYKANKQIGRPKMRK